MCDIQKESELNDMQQLMAQQKGHLTSELAAVNDLLDKVSLTYWIFLQNAVIMKTYDVSLNLVLSAYTVRLVLWSHFNLAIFVVSIEKQYLQLITF